MQSFLQHTKGLLGLVVPIIAPIVIAQLPGASTDTQSYLTNLIVGLATGGIVWAVPNAKK